MPELIGNLLVAQGGEPSAAVNAILAGVIQQSGKHECLEQIYGGLHGLQGVLREDLVDLNEELARSIEGLKYAPACALGACRDILDFKSQPERAARDMGRLFEVFQAHNIRYFIYIGGTDALEAARLVHERAKETGYELRVIGVPAAINNNLPYTDHCPGFGSAVKLTATTVMEIAAGASSIPASQGSCLVLEATGRDSGWIAAGSALAKRADADAPHIVLVPEVPFAEANFLARVKEVAAAQPCCVVVASEGLKDLSGKTLAPAAARLDAFGRPALSGVSEFLSDLIGKRLGIESRSLKLGDAPRVGAHWASASDLAEAAACGEGAVRAAVRGESGSMVKLVRLGDAPYKCTTDLQPLASLSDGARLLPREWMSEDGFMPNEHFLAYARPLITGDFKVPVEGGLPKFAALAKSPVDKLLPPPA